VNGKIGGINQGWLIALALFLIFLVIQRYTYIGKKIIAIGSNELMCKMSGVDVMSAKIVAFMMSGIGSAVGAVILSSYLYSAYPTIGEVYILESIAVVVVGGTAMTGGSGGIVNTLVVAVIMSMLKNGMTIIGIDVYAQQTFLGVLIILAVAASFDRKKLSFIK
jgi:ribose/xylose/arabinose/galactoside ABC-type transport system permease subunit